MALPKQVVENARRADAVLAGVNGQGQPPVEDAPQNPTMQPVQAVPAGQPDAAGVEHDWQKRFGSFKASADATIHQQREDLTAANRREQEMQERIDALEVRNLEEDVAAPIDITGGLLSEDEINLFGDANVKIVLKIVNMVVQETVGRAQTHQAKQAQASEKRRDQLNSAKTQETNRVEDFKTKLAQVVPDWPTIDNDPGFNTWMSQVDTVSGSIRSTLMVAAFRTHDVGRVAEFYNEFTATQNPPDPRLNQVVPNAVPNSGVPPDVNQGTAGKKIWTTAEIGDFYSAKRRGQFQNKEDEARAIEIEIFAAQKDV